MCLKVPGAHGFDIFRKGLCEGSGMILTSETFKHLNLKTFKLFTY